MRQRRRDSSRGAIADAEQVARLRALVRLRSQEMPHAQFRVIGIDTLSVFGAPPSNRRDRGGGSRVHMSPRGGTIGEPEGAFEGSPGRVARRRSTGEEFEGGPSRVVRPLQ